MEKFVPEKLEEKNGYVYVWRHGTGWPVSPADVEAFIAHMETWLSICGETFTRGGYEAACADLGVTPDPDDLLGGYRDVYGNFGMGHYHADPKNRQFGIAATLHQGRWRGLELEREHKQAATISEASPAPKIGREGQLWESCKCGREPVYLPLHLCDNCWPIKEEVE